MTAIELFRLTIAVVFGILLPGFLLVLWYALTSAVVDSLGVWRARAEDKAQAGPYSKAELVTVPNVMMLGIRLYDRSGKLVHEMSADDPRFGRRA